MENEPKASEKAALIILDGWGIGPDPERSAIAQASTPYMDGLLKIYPNSTLITHGLEVGLPAGQMGNSEVGHLNIGAGRVVYQELARINKAIEEGTLAQNEVLREALSMANSGRKMHLMGLLSDGGVHSHIEHLKALIDICTENNIEDTCIHAFLDGRDTPPNGGVQYLQSILSHCENNTARLATIVGRYYAMDRDKRWERIHKAYDLMVNGVGSHVEEPIDFIKEQYGRGITDEFMEPIILDPNGTIGPDDIVICFNFRTDRPRQITEALTQKDFPEQNMKVIPLHYVTMTMYDQTFQNIHVLFEKDNLNQTLGEVIAANRLTQVRLAETEKYPHVTYFFSGGREENFPGEDRIVIPSPKVATYDLQPEMSATKVTDAILQKVSKDHPDFICLNYANTDMVGHTGDFQAAQVAAQTVDHCLKQLIPHLQEYNYNIIIIADHGNSDYMINDDGSPHTAHTTNLVPCILISKNAYTLDNGKLADVAPTLCKLMNIDIPQEMTGNVLVRKK